MYRALAASTASALVVLFVNDHVCRGAQERAEKLEASVAAGLTAASEAAANRAMLETLLAESQGRLQRAEAERAGVAARLELAEASVAAATARESEAAAALEAATRELGTLRSQVSEAVARADAAEASAAAAAVAREELVGTLVVSGRHAEAARGALTELGHRADATNRALQGRLRMLETEVQARLLDERQTATVRCARVWIKTGGRGSLRGSGSVACNVSGCVALPAFASRRRSLGQHVQHDVHSPGSWMQGRGRLLH